jgi:hypothetical protein
MHAYLRAYVSPQERSKEGVLELLEALQYAGNAAAIRAMSASGGFSTSARRKPLTLDKGVSAPNYPLFVESTEFWDRLVEMTRMLAHRRTREERTQELRRQLRIFGTETLPSTAVFVPVGNCRHRLG